MQGSRVGSIPEFYHLLLPRRLGFGCEGGKRFLFLYKMVV